MEDNNNNTEERPNTSLNKKRRQKLDDESSTKQQTSFFHEKPQTQQGSRKSNQNQELRGSTSQSQFRAVNMTQSFYNQAQKELGFNPPHSNKQDFNKTMSSTFKGSFFGGAHSSKNYSSVIPKNIIYDKEVLYDELLKTKTTKNNLIKENSSLKTRLIGLHEEMLRLNKKDIQNPYDMDQNKYKKVFQEQMSSSVSFQKNHSTTLILNLKKHISELQNEITLKDAALQKIQRAVKLTSIKELEVQLKMYSEECLRLRRMLEQQMKLERDERFKNDQSIDGTALEGNNSNQAFLVLKQDNIQMAANLKKFEEEVFAQRIVIETLEKQLRQSKYDNQQQRRVIYEKDREIESFKGNDPFTNNGKKNSQFTVEGQLKIELDKKQQELNLITHQIQQKEKRIMDVEKKSREKEADFMDKITSEIKEKQEIQNLLDKERDTVFKLRQDIERLQSDRRFTKPDLIGSQATINDIDNFSPGEQTTRFNNRKSVRQNTNISVRSQQFSENGSLLNVYARRRLPRVSHEEIMQIGEDLKYRLKLQRVSLNQIEKYLFKEESLRVSEISLQDIYNSLQEYPFKISDENSLVCLSRYLIEDNSQDWVQFDPGMTNSVSVVKSVLRHLLDNYTISSQQQEVKDLVKVTQVLNKSKGVIIDMLQRDPASKRINGIMYCDKKQIVALFDQLEIQFSSTEVDLIFVKLYEDSSNLSQIKIDSIFKIFNQEQYNSNTQISMKDIVDNTSSNSDPFKNNLNEQQQKTHNFTKKNSQKGDGNVNQMSNKSKAFKNVLTNDFNVYNSNVDQDAVAANQNNYQLEDEEEVESQGQISNYEEQEQRQQNQNGQSRNNSQPVNNNSSHQVNYLNIAQEHEAIMSEQTKYTQQTNSQLQNDPHDPYQDSNEEQ